MTTIRLNLMTIGLVGGLAASAFAGRPTGPWCGDQPPDRSPQLFAPGFISTDACESGGTFSPDGREFYFMRHRDPDGTDRRIWWTRSELEGWRQPELAPFAAPVIEVDPHLTPDGGRLYFGSARSGRADSGHPSQLIWAVDRVDGTWSPPFRLDAVINAEATSSICAVRDGSLYAVSTVGLVRFELSGVGFEPRRRLAESIQALAGVGHPHVPPDERLLLFEATSATAGDSDLYVCTRDAVGTWSEPARLPAPVNTEAAESHAFLAPGGRDLFFTRTTADGADIWWVSAEILDDLICGP